MAGEDIIMVRHKELRRLHVIHKVLGGEITQEKAAELAGLSEQQVRSDMPPFFWNGINTNFWLLKTYAPTLWNTIFTHHA
ncbi:MAG: hypothetical protein AB1553_01445 [Nitrospirota bacterium]